MNIGDIYNSVSGGLGKAAGSISSLFQQPEPVPTPVVIPPAKYNLKDRGVDITDEDLKAIRPLIYGEVSNRNTPKKTLEANVILNTAINRVKANNDRGNPKTVSQIIAEPNQYQAFGGKQYQMYHNPTDPIALAKKQEVDSIIDGIAEQIKAGTFKDNTQGAHYYIHNPDSSITYDNKRKLFK